MSMHVPRIFAGLVDDAAVFPPGSAELPDAVVAHRDHRAAWYADLVGPFLLPASAVDRIGGLTAPDESLDIGLIGDTGIGALPAAVAALDPGRVRVRQVEVAVAKRGEDPQPGLRALLTALAGWPKISGYAEVPLTWGLLAALDALAEARAGGVDVAAKFRTGGLAAELFPTPVELAAVICACRDRALPFKLTAGLHHAIRDTDPETGFTHHGFLNVLAGTIAAAEGGEVAEVAELLATTDAARLIEPARTRGSADRPLWVGFGSCSIPDPLTDLVRLGLINGGFA
ncbi:hypothetical protein O7632_30625 [Solwaraspora sp. WMMD406]|uniref:hypothetical protein n=1 Tax=Solwaraspora sp. WMMD406 TaxID=3016095 RepID=UPI0024169033|nr:hypothetical protein [Solwaraspora sp. WMMD406]MDG4768416.1 hypothetical protein [Solwaraspora sp. WMMD406]